MALLLQKYVVITLHSDVIQSPQRLSFQIYNLLQKYMALAIHNDIF